MKARVAMQLDREGCKCSVLVAAAVLTASVPAIAQAGGGEAAALQQKMAAVKESVADNKQRLHQYQWMETTQHLSIQHSDDGRQ